MQKVHVDNLCLEITRRCNLKCMHCLRGDSENKDMSNDILNNIFSDISSIRRLDLMGGEPLLAPNVIENLIKIINERKIKIDVISFTTNGTVMSQRHVELLQQLKNIANLDVRLSHDKFHLIEITKKGLADISKRNLSTFKELLGYSPEEKEFFIDEFGIRRVGRAKGLTQEVLDVINKWRYPTEYCIVPLTWQDTDDIIEISDWGKDVIKVFGHLSISVNGYLTRMDQEYSIEDFDPVFNLSVKNQRLLDVLKQYESICQEDLGNDYARYRDLIEERHK